MTNNRMLSQYVLDMLSTDDKGVCRLEKAAAEGNTFALATYVAEGGSFDDCPECFWAAVDTLQATTALFISRHTSENVLLKAYQFACGIGQAQNFADGYTFLRNLLINAEKASLMPAYYENATKAVIPSKTWSWRDTKELLFSPLKTVKDRVRLWHVKRQGKKLWEMGADFYKMPDQADEATKKKASDAYLSALYKTVPLFADSIKRQDVLVFDYLYSIGDIALVEATHDAAKKAGNGEKFEDDLTKIQELAYQVRCARRMQFDKNNKVQMKINPRNVLPKLAFPKTPEIPQNKDKRAAPAYPREVLIKDAGVSR